MSRIIFRPYTNLSLDSFQKCVVMKYNKSKGSLSSASILSISVVTKKCQDERDFFGVSSMSRQVGNVLVPPFHNHFDKVKKDSKSDS